MSKSPSTDLIAAAFVFVLPFSECNGMQYSSKLYVLQEAADDDDLDLFGDETEEEKKAAEEREAAVKASSKKKESNPF